MSLSEIIVVLLVALLAFGPKRLPEVAYGIGRLVQWVIGIRQAIAAELNKHMREIELQHNEAKAKASEQMTTEQTPAAQIPGKYQVKKEDSNVRH